MLACDGECVTDLDFKGSSALSPPSADVTPFGLPEPPKIKFVLAGHKQLKVLFFRMIFFSYA